ncbi:hypothetical protein [Nonomuraea sp. NPDC049028]|uniref:hypothetical protein n=1 Tax=Nonomuraea sp. NPDC049028 TaxID=3364348 RepID=UPI00371C5969
MDWVTTLVPVGSLITGAVLTMLGQSLADRRALRREHEARKEQFHAKNFEIHRDALLKLQEAVVEFSSRIKQENVRREGDGDYEFWDSQPAKPINTAFLKLQHFSDDIRTAITELRDELTQEETKTLFKRFVLNARASRRQAKTIGSQFRTMGDVFARKLPFATVREEFSQQLHVHMYRTGSDRIVEAAKDHLSAITEWEDRLVSEDRDGLYYRIAETRHDLLVTIGGVLREGPFGK